MLSACPECGELTEATWCEAHRPKPGPKRPTNERGYDAAWKRLSRQARRLQPWCTDCGATTNLSADHTPEAWQRKAQGLPLRLVDVEVVCVPCNAKRGAARGPQARGVDPTHPASDPDGQAKFRSQTRGGAPWR